MCMTASTERRTPEPISEAVVSQRYQALLPVKFNAHTDTHHVCICQISAAVSEGGGGGQSF